MILISHTITVLKKYFFVRFLNKKKYSDTENFFFYPFFRTKHISCIRKNENLCPKSRILEKKIQKIDFFWKKLNKIDFFFIIQRENYDFTLKNWIFEFSLFRTNGIKKWSFFGFFDKIEGSRHRIVDFLTVKNMICTCDFDKNDTFCQNMSHPCDFEINPFFSIFLSILEQKIPVQEIEIFERNINKNGWFGFKVNVLLKINRNYDWKRNK